MSVSPVRQLIVGGGVAGLSTAWHLAERGAGGDTVLLEAEPHLAAHSSAQNAAILRTLSSDPISTQLGAESARFLRDPPAGFSEVPIVDAFGLVLAAGSERAEELAGWAKRAESLGLPDYEIEGLSSARFRAMLPAFEAPVRRAFWFPREGRLDIGALVAGYARGARRGGVQIRRDARVRTLLRSGDAVLGAELESGERIHAERTVVAAGGWASTLARAVGSSVMLRPTRRHLMVTDAQPAADRGWPILWYFGDAAEGEFYCRPEGAGMLLCACDLTDVEPGRFDVVDDVRRQIASKTARYLPALAGASAAHFWCGMRTLTADGRFCIGADPDLEGLFWVAGLGGSGMLCSPEVGRFAAARLCDPAAEPELARALDPGRLVESG